MSAARQDTFAQNLQEYVRRRDMLNRLPADTSNQCEDAYCDLHDAAEKRLINTPAKSIADLRAKAEAIWTSPHSVMPIDAVMRFFADLSRLDASPSRTFDASYWLEVYESNGGGWIERDGEIILINNRDAGCMAELLFELDTRDGMDAVKASIRERRTSADQPCPKDWAQMLSDYQTAKARMDEHNASCTDAPSGTPESKAHDVKASDLCHAHDIASGRLLLTAAPDRTALQIKLDMLASDIFTEAICSDHGEYMKQIADDGRRLLGKR